MNIAPITDEQLEKLGFISSLKNPERPRAGSLLLCYHQVYGMTVGYWGGDQACFILPFVVGYNWASHWQYHN